NYPKADWDFQADERLFALIRYMLLTTPAAELAEVLDVSEGIENKLKKAAVNAKSLDELIQLTKSKRFTYAKISRILMQMILGITKRNVKSKQDTVKILAFNEKGKKVLKEASKTGTLEFGPSKFDANAHDIYNILTGKDIYSNSDYVINSKPFDK
ncbi:MAG: nucleotidyltransferase family protein, partial [Bacillota bacterium]|nr:nucleotidyltransferase family protein [Bacillota bacterium]